MSTSPTPPTADRDLLFGVLALRLGFLSGNALDAGMAAWAGDQDRPLGRVLCDQGAVTPARLAQLDALVDEHLAAAGGSQSDAELAQRSTLSPSAGGTGWGGPPDGARFRNRRHHAGGGLGEVFVADDAELNREVALKQIQPHRADDPACRARFLREARITGALEHPGVIPIYGLGTDADGRPFYAMRFVRGESLKTAADRYHAADAAERPAQLRRLIRRLIDVCNAVAYAHSRGVIHRDLKPANVMLGPFGETLVVDWGLAKSGIESRPGPTADATVDAVVRPALTDEALVSLAGSALGTPGYMSPEQAAGRHDVVAPASDVFGLGATLYYLLTGRKPFEGNGIQDVMERTREGRLVPLRQAKPGVPQPLDAVCRKALAHEPADRYPSALDLAADLERWLADEPVSVYRDPWPVRAARWGRRHRTAAAAVAVLLVTAVVSSAVGVGLLWKEQQKTAAQKREAEENYALARDLSVGGIELIAANEALYAADPAKHKARKELLVAAAKAYRKHLEHQPDDPEVRRQAARVYRYAANVHRLEREHAAAEALYRDAVELLEGLVRQFPQQTEHQIELSNVLRDRAHVQARLGRLAEAVASLDRVIALADAALAVHPEDPGNRRTRALGLLSRAGTQHVRGKLAEAGADAAAAVKVYEALAEKRDETPVDPLMRAAAVNVLALVDRDEGRPEKARARHREAIKLVDPLLKQPRPGINPIDVEHFRMHFVLEQARTLALTGRRDLAETNFGLLAGRWQQIAREHPENPEYGQLSGEAYYERGRVRAEGKPGEARADFNRAREILEGEVRRSPDVPALSGDLGRAYAGLGRLARAASDPVATDWFGKATAALRSAVERAPERARDRQSLRDVEAEAPR